MHSKLILFPFLIAVRRSLERQPGVVAEMPLADYKIRLEHLLYQCFLTNVHTSGCLNVPCDVYRGHVHADILDELCAVISVALEIEVG